MKTVEIIGYKRANLGKSSSKQYREEGLVPSVLYGGAEQVHFAAPMILFRDLVYTSEARFVNLNIEGKEYQAILQDIQFHPVSEIILHADFLLIDKSRKIKMNIPIAFNGVPVGVERGGNLVRKKSALKIQAFPQDMPEQIDIDLSGLDFHQSIKVVDLKLNNIEVLDPKQATIAVIEVPRAAKVAAEETGKGGKKK
jgi:large subunit ribosomal protein L25